MRVAVIDTETTGLGPAARVVELAVVVVDLGTGEVVREAECLVRQALTGSRDELGALALCRLTSEDLAGAATADEVRPWWRAKLAGVDSWTAYNRGFDERMLARDDLLPLAPAAECLLTAAWRARGTVRPRLADACRWAEVEGPGAEAHGALADAQAAARLLVALHRFGQWNRLMEWRNNA